MNQKMEFKGRGFYRKSKAYGLVCGIALAGAVMMANTQVSADETTATTPIVTVTENPATNLVEAQSASSVENTQTAANAGQQTGELVSPVTSTELDTAVSEAQAAGVAVTTEETATTHDSLASAEADLSKQTAEVVTTTEKQQANTESIKAATEKNAEIDAQNKAEAKRVAEVNKKGQAAVDQRNTLGQAAVDQRNKEGQAAVDARNAANQKRIEDNKRAVEERNKQGQAAVDQRNAQNQAAVDKRNAEGQAAIDEANKQAKAVADMENAQLKKEYEAALAGVKEVEAFNAAVRKRNAAAEAEASKKNAALQADYEKKMEEMRANTNKEAWLQEAVAQSLIFKTEPEATAKISGQVANVSKEVEKWNYDAANFMNVEAYKSLGNPETPQVQERGTTWYTVIAKKGQPVTIVYDNLVNTSYEGRKISSVKYVYTVEKYDGADEVVMMLATDPTKGIKYGTEIGFAGTGLVKVDQSIEFFYENGEKVQFSPENQAVFSVSSMNADDVSDPNHYYEYMTMDQSMRFIPINGSTIGLVGNTVQAVSGNNNAEDLAENNTFYDWDNEEGSPVAYRGAGAVVVDNVSSEIHISFGSTNPSQHWFAFNTDVKAPTLPAKPQPQKVTYEKEKEVPTTPVEPKYVTPEVKTFTPETFTPEVFTPEKPSTEEFKPETFTPEIFTPEKYTPVTPTVLPHVQVPEKIQYKVAVHPVKVKQTPVNVKDVVDTDGVSIDGQLVPKGSIQTWTLTNANLKAGREEVTSYVMDDPFPADFEIDREATAAKNDSYLLSYDENGKVQLVATQATLNSFNANRDQDVVVPVAYFVGRPLNDGGTYQNTFTTTIQTPTGEFKVVSNTPVIYTPGNDPKTPRDRGGENPTPHDNLIQPEKHNYNEQGTLIDGKVVFPNQVNAYVAKWDMDQYKGITASAGAIAQGFAYIDDYQDDALVAQEGQFTITDAAGKTVNGLTMYHVLSTETASEAIKAMVKASGVSPVGAFYMWVADKPEEFYIAYVKTGTNLYFHLPMTIKEGFTGKYTNKTFQIDFGNGYYSNVVENEVPTFETTKKVTVDGKDVNGQEIALNQTFTYELNHVLVPANRAEKLFQYDFKDDYDETGDKYTGHYHVSAKVDFTYTDKDGNLVAVKAGDDLTDFTTLVDKDGQLLISFDKAFLESISDDSAFQASAYPEFERIASGTFENTFVGIVNGNEVVSNTVKTTTPEPEKPSEPTSPTPSIPVQKANVLPSTGEASSALGVLGAILSVFGLAGIRKRKENVK